MANPSSNNDFDLLSFKYNGSMWCFEAQLLNVKDNISIYLQNTNLEKFDFENSVNNLILKGSIVYTDEYGKLDKLLAEAYATCYVRFWKKKGKSEDDNTGFEVGTEDIKFEHHFIVLNVNILDRKKNTIKYQLDIISQNWIKYNKRLKYTNYAKDPEPITEILKKLLVQAGFNIDAKSFALNISPVKINYITKVNDTIMTAMNYLLRRMYYDKEEGLEDAIKFLSYDFIKDKIYLTNVSKDTTFLSETIAPMSCFDSSIEDMANQCNIEMASLNKIRKTDFFKSFEFHHPYKYDPEKNEIKNIKDTELCPKAMTNWFENVFTDIKVTPAKTKMSIPIREVFVNDSDRWENYWNNNMNIYDEHLQSLLYNESVVVSIDGQLNLNSGALFGIRVDRDLAGLQKLDGDNKADLIERFKKFEGLWIVARTRHIVYPMERKYKTNLTLSRNYTPVITRN